MNKTVVNRSVVIALASASAMGLVGCGSNDGVADAISSITPATSEELGTASAESAAIAVAECEATRCSDVSDVLGVRSVHQHMAQNTATAATTFSVDGLMVERALFSTDLFRLSLFWDIGSVDGTSSLDFGEDDRVDLHDSGDYYYSTGVETGVGTSEVFVHALSGNTDTTATEDDADYLVGGVWLFTPSIDDAVVEVGAFADVHGQPIPADDLVALDTTATYGAMGGRPEAGGYHLNDDNVATPFLADAVLTAEFGSTTAPGTISGEITNTNYIGTRFTLMLNTAMITAADGGLFNGVTAGPTDGALVDDEWEGTWGGKFFGLDGTAEPDFVYGTFGARDTDATDAADPPASILGFFLAEEQP